MKVRAAAEDDAPKVFPHNAIGVARGAVLVQTPGGPAEVVKRAIRCAGELEDPRASRVHDLGDYCDSAAASASAAASSRVTTVSLPQSSMSDASIVA